MKGFFDRKGNIIDYYEIFSVPSDAGLDDIKSAFRLLIKRYHPDTTDRNMENAAGKFDFIINGYRILADSETRKEYDSHLILYRSTGKIASLVIPKKRIKYSMSLEQMIKARIRPGNLKKNDLLSNFGQDVEIMITAAEAIKGAKAYVDLPSRMICPLCTGMDPQCYLCRGIGRIHTISQIEVTIPPRVKNGTLIESDLIGLKPDRFTTFRSKSIRIRIEIQGKKK